MRRRLAWHGAGSYALTSLSLNAWGGNQLSRRRGSLRDASGVRGRAAGSAHPRDAPPRDVIPDMVTGPPLFPGGPEIDGIEREREWPMVDSTSSCSLWTSVVGGI